MADGSVFFSNTGTIELYADEDVTLGLLQTSNTSAAAVTVTSTSESIQDADAGNGLDIVADGVTAGGPNLGEAGRDADRGYRHRQQPGPCPGLLRYRPFTTDRPWRPRPTTSRP